jgi:hypothetical protein
MFFFPDLSQQELSLLYSFLFDHEPAYTHHRYAKCVNDGDRKMILRSGSNVHITMKEDRDNFYYYYY